MCVYLCVLGGIYETHALLKKITFYFFIDFFF